jgi:hypothetical protein
VERWQEIAYIVDALLALHEESERRHKERKERMQQRADVASQQGPVGEDDVGWDF